MLTFSYNALDKFNSYVKGTISADNVKKATILLEKEGFIIVNINQQKGKSFSKFNKLFESVSRVDQMFFTRHLYTMLESGMPLDQVIKVTAEQTTNPTFRQILDSVHDRLVRGQTLHSALNEHKKHFSQLFINLVKVGEMSGKLDKVLEHVLEQQEKDYDLITRARGAMVYPAIIIVALFAMVTMMMVFVIPKVTGILTEYDVELPIATRVLIWLSNFLIHYGFLLVPVLAVLIALFIRWTRSPKGKAKWDGFLLKIPRLKTILIEFNLARISRALSTLLSSGVQLDQSLELASGVPGNYLYQDSLRSGIKFIQRGIPLAEVLKGYPKLYPSIASRMTEVGERTGKLEHMLQRLATYYEKSVSNTITNLASVIEPVLLLSIGFSVGFVAIAILTPIWKFSATI